LVAYTFKSGIDIAHADTWAAHLYETILAVTSNTYIVQQMTGPEVVHTWTSSNCPPSWHGKGSCKDWTESWALLNMDLVTALTLLHLRSGGLESDATHYIKATFQYYHRACHVSPESEAFRYHIQAFYQVEARWCEQALTSFERARMQRRIAGLDTDPALDEDYRKQQLHIRSVSLPQPTDMMCIY
jgi:hypothetical protein